MKLKEIYKKINKKTFLGKLERFFIFIPIVIIGALGLINLFIGTGDVNLIKYPNKKDYFGRISLMFAGLVITLLFIVLIFIIFY